MRFHADLHVHSKYSRATSRDLDLEHLAHWAARKGIGVVATGDFAHPVWRAELKQKLVPAEPGMFRLRDDIEHAVAATLPPSCRVPVRFMLEVEISTIYKKSDRTRKIHHLIYAPDFATADRFAERLARIGNIVSDGRPILGLDSRDLLEITLESGPDAYLVPAHIWTPWFAALGSQSGFDSIADCYGDLAPNIFAVETGLSSDPPMNWRVSFLDRYRLTSNSDAHSPGKLGREATTFDCERDYFAIKQALETGRGYVGTVEFFPDEGKYHLDGHRKCGVRLSPKETLANECRCPVCGGALTIGVEHRVEVLADRSEEEAAPPATAGTVTNLVPLPEILSEITRSGPTTKTVEQAYNRVIAALGPELSILQSAPAEDIGRASTALLAEAIARLRAGKVIRDPGYDGEYGVISLFEDGELQSLTAGEFLFDAPAVKKMRRASPSPAVDSSLPLAGLVPRGSPPPCGGGTGRGVATGTESVANPLPTTPPKEKSEQAESATPANSNAPPARTILAQLDNNQRAAASSLEGPLLIIAGPGSGKTRTLTHRIAHLVADRGVAPASCLAITFTRRAAAEMRERLAHLIPHGGADHVAVHTFHSFGLSILRAHPHAAGLHRGFRITGEGERTALLAQVLGVSSTRAERLMRAISRAKRAPTKATAETADALAAYQRSLALHNAIDFDDLIALAVRAFESDPGLATQYRERFPHISVDEFQDVDEQQYSLLALIGAPNLCVIGDPDQGIYGFRGADASCFDRFRREHPAANVVRLTRNYRSSGTIVTAAAQVIAARKERPIAELVRELYERITIHVAPSEAAEAEAVVAAIERMIGGATFFSMDSARADGTADRDYSFSDFAVLFRTAAQATALAQALARSGMPFKKAAHGALADDPAVQALLRHGGDGVDDDASIAHELQRAAHQLEADDRVDQGALTLALQRLIALAQTCGEDRARFLDAVALASDSDDYDPRADRISLMTLHAAKGLEFPVVFIVGLEDGLLPLKWRESDDAALAEERRLFYVGMTRARDRLILSRARQRRWRGRLRQLETSPFLADIEHELLKHQRAELPRKPQDRQLSLF